jgi:hypothetical protein
MEKMIVKQQHHRYEIEVVEITPISVFDEKIFGKQRNVICKMNDKEKVLIINDSDEIIHEPLCA